MARMVAWAQSIALSIGGPGLFFIAFLDSSFLSLPEINDLLVVLLVIQHKERMLYYAMMATLGSLLGCLVLYYIGRKGGTALAKRRFGGRRMEQALSLYARYGAMAIAIPAVLPPPSPFKVFVLLAGIAGVPVLQFAAVIAMARGFRYTFTAWLSVRYGDQAIALLEEHGRAITIAIAVVVIGGVAVWLMRRGRHRESPEET